MKTLLKTNLFFSCFTVLLCFGITALSHGQAVVSVDPAENASPGVGSQLTIRLKISNGKNVAGYEVGVNFDTSALRYVSGTNGSYLPSGAFFAPPQVSGGKVTLAATSVSGAARNSSGTLARVTFSVVAVKKSTLRLTGVLLSDSNANALSVSVRNGSVVESRGPKWDVNGDGRVNVLDLTRVATRLGSRDSGADTNGDGTVNVLDLVLVAQHLGETVGQTTPSVTVPAVTQPAVPQPPSVPQQPTPPAGMVLIPAGEFEMGSEDAEAGNDEQPVHTVHVDAFYMDAYEVTNLDYKKFVLANPQWQKSRIPKAFHDGSYLKHWTGNNYPTGKANHPVTYVSWYAAVAYSKWVGKRLPTEAEWEKAARGGKSGLKYPWGNMISSDRANYDNNVGGTREVGSYSKNGYGLYDMSGNVSEWCLDAYDANFYFTSPGRNPLSDVNTIANIGLIVNDYTNVKSHRVWRGGSSISPAHRLRVAFRSLNRPTFSHYSFGFRCTMSVK